ncbi:hypothetical protein HDV06_001487, partial [Boothiomyces sp. JEL0866]
MSISLYSLTDREYWRLIAGSFWYLKIESIEEESSDEDDRSDIEVGSMEIFLKLPTEIWDKIFLEYEFSYSDIRNTRILQSDYVKKTTQYFNSLVAAEKGNFDNVLWIIKNFYDDTQTCVMAQAALQGKLEVFKILENYDICIEEYIFQYAVQGGYLEILEYLKEKDYPYDNESFYAANENGNPQVIEWVNQNLIYEGNE